MNEQNKTARQRGTDSAKVIQVVETKALIGLGTYEDPCRLLIQYWSLDGQLLAKMDSYIEEERMKSNE